jgi:hypothetical protein
MTRPKLPFFRRVSDNTTKSNLIDHCKSPAQPAGHKSLQPGCKPRRQTLQLHAPAVPFDSSERNDVRELLIGIRCVVVQEVLPYLPSVLIC